MNPFVKRFLIRSSLLTAILFLLGCYIYIQLIPEWYHPFLPVVLLLFFATTNLIHYYLLKRSSQKRGRFISGYMASNFIKMFVYLAFAIGFALYHREQAKSFLINFLFLYLVFSILEVYEISRIVKQKN